MERTPLINEVETADGVIVAATDAIARKEAEYPEIDLDFILKFGPSHIYWKNLDSVYLGCNKNFATLIGLDDPSEILGMAEHEMPWAITKPETVAHNVRADKYVIETGDMLVTEEDVGIKNANGLSVILRSEKRQLINKKGEVIGILGISVDITDDKERERLALENQNQKLQQQEQFKKIVEQAAHDLGSPLMVLNFLFRQHSNLPEQQRTMLSSSVNRIYDISRNLLNHGDKPQYNENSNTISRAPTLVQLAILEIISEKRYEYNNLSVEFAISVSQADDFVFISADVLQFKRMLSNLINNAVDALEGKPGTITTRLGVIDDQVQLIIEDNGKGMPDTVKEKILNDIAVTSGKAEGHGIGFGQIRDTLAANDGKFTIDSELGHGTKIVITFPQVEAPTWVCTKLVLKPDSLIVILDDEPSIHIAWESRFKEDAPDIKRKHFEHGKEVLNFISSLSPEEKSKLFLLTDYELLNQNLDGLTLIERTEINQAVLVTSHYGERAIQEKAQKLNTPILPKPLASKVPIVVVNDRA